MKDIERLMIIVLIEARESKDMTEQAFLNALKKVIGQEVKGNLNYVS